MKMEMMYSLYETSGAAIKAKAVFEGTGHADSKTMYKDEYYQRIFDFGDEVI